MIIASIAAFVVFIVPHYDAISAIRDKETEYNTVLANARKLEEQRNVLRAKYASFNTNQLSQLATMLPANPENVKLILELDAVASQYGMVLQNVKIDDPTSSDATQNSVPRPGTAVNNDIGALTINFSVAGPYASFTSFVKTIEKSLRIIDIQKVTFTPLDTKSNNYQYAVSIKTYWLK